MLFAGRIFDGFIPCFSVGTVSGRTTLFLRFESALGTVRISSLQFGRIRRTVIRTVKFAILLIECILRIRIADNTDFCVVKFFAADNGYFIDCDGIFPNNIEERTQRKFYTGEFDLIVVLVNRMCRITQMGFGINLICKNSVIFSFSLFRTRAVLLSPPERRRS